MLPPSDPERDFAETVPYLPPDWPGIDPSIPYPSPIDPLPPPPPPPMNFPYENRLWMRSALTIIIGLLCITIVLLILTLFSGGGSTIVRNIPQSTSTSQPNVNATATLSITGTSPITPPTATTSTVTISTATTTVSPSLTVTFTCSTVSGGNGTPGPSNLAHICVQTSAGAQVTIAALLCDGHPDGNLKQTTGTTNDLGEFQWSWPMQDPGSCQQEHITVTATISTGKTGQNLVYLPFTH